MRYQFTVHSRLPGLNEFGKHWAARAREKRAFMDLVMYEAMAAGLHLHKIRTPVHIHFCWIEQVKSGRRRDYDNISAGGKKIILDALVAKGIIPDDGPAYVPMTTDEYRREQGYSGVEVIITEVKLDENDGLP